MKRKKELTVEQQMRALDEKTSSLESMYRILVSVQKTSLTEAERLRKLALAVCKGTRMVTHGDIVPANGYLVSARALEALSDFAAGLKAFHKNPKGRKPRR